MLQTIRDNSQGLIAKIIIGFIIGLMALFGAESIVGGFLGTNTAASVNGEDITEQELAVSLQNLMGSLGAGVADFDEELLRDVALQQLIEDKLLAQAAREAGLVISAASIDREIVRTPQFQVGGRFDEEMARRTMAAQGFSPQTYRDALAQQMTMGQLANAYAATSFVTAADVARLAELEMQTRDFRYVSVPLGTRTLGEAIPEEEMRSYYDSNPAQFSEEEQVSLQYVLLDKDVIFDEVEIDDAQVRAQYESERATATASVERRASHILLDTSASSQEEVLDQARAIKQRLDAGEDFGALAREYSVDTTSAEQDGDIGFTNGSVFPASVEQALTALEVGQVSDPVVSEFGVHLVKLTEYEAQQFPEYEEVADRISRELKAAEVDQIYFDRMESLANLAFETFDLQAISEDMALEIQTTEFFGRSGGSSPVSSNPEVISQAFSQDVLTDGLNSEVIELNESRAVVIRLGEHKPSAVRPFDDVRAEIAVMLRTQKEREKAAEVGQQILSALESGTDVTDLFAAESLAWDQRNGVRRNQFDLNTEIIRSVFAMQGSQADQPVRQGFTLTNGAYVVIELQAVNPGRAEDMPEDQRQQLMTAMLDTQGRMTFDAFLATLRNNASIR